MQDPQNETDFQAALHVPQMLVQYSIPEIEGVSATDKQKECLILLVWCIQSWKSIKLSNDDGAVNQCITCVSLLPEGYKMLGDGIPYHWQDRKNYLTHRG